MRRVETPELSSFAADLRALWLAAGKPSYREISRDLETSSGRFYGKSVIGEVLAGRRAPGRARPQPPGDECDRKGQVPAQVGQPRGGRRFRAGTGRPYHPVQQRAGVRRGEDAERQQLHAVQPVQCAAAGHEHGAGRAARQQRPHMLRGRSVVQHQHPAALQSGPVQRRLVVQPGRQVRLGHAELTEEPSEHGRRLGRLPARGKAAQVGVQLAVAEAVLLDVGHVDGQPRLAGPPPSPRRRRSATRWAPRRRSAASGPPRPPAPCRRSHGCRTGSGRPGPGPRRRSAAAAASAGPTTRPGRRRAGPPRRPAGPAWAPRRPGGPARAGGAPARRARRHRPRRQGRLRAVLRAAGRAAPPAVPAAAPASRPRLLGRGRCRPDR